MGRDSSNEERRSNYLDLIVEAQYARNYSSKFQVEFWVREEEPDDPRLELGMRLGNHTPCPRRATFALRLPIHLPLKYPTRVCFLGGGA